MAYWICVDDDHRKQVKADRKYSGKTPLERNLSLTLGLEPMLYSSFCCTVAKMLKAIGMNPDEYVTIKYLPVREDHVSGIQACRHEADGNMWVEIEKVFDDGIPFHSYTKFGVSVEDTIDIFGRLLVDYECPDLSDWDETTEIINEGMKRQTNIMKES